MSNRVEPVPSANSAFAFVQTLTAFTKTLADRGFVVTHLHCDWGSFGGWSIELARGGDFDAYSEAIRRGEYDTWGPQVLRFWWDGRERSMLIETSPTPPLSAPNRWERIDDRAFDDAEAARAFILEHLSHW